TITKDLGATNPIYQVTLTYDPAKVTVNALNYTPSPAPSPDNNFGLLTEDVTFKSLSPITLSFSEKYPEKVGAPTTSATSGGFKFTLHEVLTNNTFTWDGFKEEIKDFNFPNIKQITLSDGTTVRGSTEHPVFAHFHPGNALQPPAPEQFKSGLLPTVRPDLTTNGDGVASFALSGGEVEGGDKKQVLDISGLFIHAIDVQGVKRSFDLIQTPRPLQLAGVPEPANFILLG